MHEWKIGTHTAWFEPPDALWLKVRGITTQEDAIALLEVYREVGGQQPVFLITDLTEATFVDMKARDHIAWNTRVEWLRGSIYIGGGLMQKAVANSMTFLHSITGSASVSLHFVSTEREARALLDKERSLRGT